MSTLIGLCGKKRSGKDTIADILHKKYDFIKYSFAGPMKEACKNIFMLTDEQVNGDKKAEVDERWGVTPRKLLQVIGTELFQYDIHNHMEDNEFNVGRELWVKRFEFFYNENISSFDDVVVTDVRFKHEVKRIREMGGRIWKIHRSSVESSDQHPSEKEIDEIEGDHVIHNNGTIQDLNENVNMLIDDFSKTEVGTPV